MINRSSLSQTIDAINEMAFNGQKATQAERVELSQFIASRHALPLAYANTFAGFPAELADGILLFTGERITSASARHILGEEASRALRFLAVNDKNVDATLAQANGTLLAQITRASFHPRNASAGQFCCGKCTVGMWRNLLSGGLDRQNERLKKGVKDVLHASRTGKEQWKTFPFWYTVYALSEMTTPEARRELEYAAPALERAAKRKRPDDLYGARRHELARRVMERM